MTTTHDADSLRGWTPVRFFRGDDGQPAVEWRQLGDQRLTAPFFVQTVQQSRARHDPALLTSAGVLSDLADAEPDLPLAGLVFHLSRCGSTLVTQMLASRPAHVVLSEPEPVDEVLRSDRWPQPAARAARVGWLRGLLRAWGARRFPEERRLLLKLDPWHILDRDMIRAAWPGVPWVFLYRDPVEILVSQSDNLAATLCPDDHKPGRIGLTPAEVSRLSVEEYCARVLGRVAEEMADAAAGDPGIRLVAYPQLPAAVETLIAPGFGLTLDAVDRERMRQAARFHAKVPGQQVFREDSARKQRDADAELRALADHWIGRAYARLESARQAQGDRLAR